MSSHSRKSVQPSLRALEMAYLALSFFSSAVTPGVTSSRSTQRGSTAARSSTRKRPLLRLLSCKSRMLAVEPVEATFSRAHCRMSSSLAAPPEPPRLDLSEATVLSSE
jgi:hypothetical protein